MKNLGKVILILLLNFYTLNASVRATVDATTVELGEMVTYSLHISGQDIVRPKIQVLCEVDVISTSTQTSIEMINGDVTRSNILQYKFIPQKDCVIEPMKVEIAGKIEKSNLVNIKVKKVVTNKDSDFILTLQSSKKEVFVGEPFKVILLFKQRNDAEAVDSEFNPPKLNGFWIKNEAKPQRIKGKKYTTTKIVYTMAAQRVGKLEITKAQMRIATRSHSRDSWGSWIPRIKWKTYFSNSLEVDVKALPNDIDLVGNFSILATVDKSEVNANEAINLSLEVLGIGNLEDIKNLKPYIDGINIFDEKIIINGNKLTQKIVFVGENDFIIPAFTLKYFDPNTKEIKITSTNEISIKIKNAKPKEKLVIKRDEKVEKIVVTDKSIPSFWIVIGFILGMLFGIVIMQLKPWKFKKKEKSPSIKEPKKLFIKLLPFKDDEKVKQIIDALEKNIYEDVKVEINKKTLKEVLKKYNIL